MAEWLEGSWAKVGRGDKHVETFECLRRKIESQPDPPGATVRQYVDLDTSEWVAEVVEVDALPVEMGVVMGDAIHNFRSALDQMVFELAFIGSGGQEKERTMFPCSDTIGNWRSAHVQNVLLGGLTTRQKAAVQRLQPYRRWEWPYPGNHPFKTLSDLSNDDKHRVVQPVLVALESFALNLRGTRRDCYLPPPGTSLSVTMISRAIEPKTELLRWPVVIFGPNPDMQMKLDPALAIGLRNGVRADAVLRDIARLTRKALEVIGPQFDTRKAHRLKDLPRYGRITPGSAPDERISGVEIRYGP